MTSMVYQRKGEFAERCRFRRIRIWELDICGGIGDWHYVCYFVNGKGEVGRGGWT
jgi:hypothetical protein